jgi:hypothetical protein
MQASRTTHIDLFVTTVGASPGPGSARADALASNMADALGHVPVMPKEVVGYCEWAVVQQRWYSPAV